MGHAAVATTAAGVALLVYWVLSRRMAGTAGEKGRETRKSLVRLPAQAPATWRDVVATLAETVRFTYSETLGKWPIGDLAFGINYLMRQQVGWILVNLDRLVRILVQVATFFMIFFFGEGVEVRCFLRV